MAALIGVPVGAAMSSPVWVRPPPRASPKRLVIVPLTGQRSRPEDPEEVSPELPVEPLPEELSPELPVEPLPEELSPELPVEPLPEELSPELPVEPLPEELSLELPVEPLPEELSPELPDEPLPDELSDEPLPEELSPEPELPDEPSEVPLPEELSPEVSNATPVESPEDPLPLAGSNTAAAVSCALRSMPALVTTGVSPAARCTAFASGVPACSTVTLLEKSFIQVCASTRPVTVSPSWSWKEETAASVSGPKMPSSGTPSSAWIWATALPVSPRRRSWGGRLGSAPPPWSAVGAPPPEPVSAAAKRGTIGEASSAALMASESPLRRGAVRRWMSATRRRSRERRSERSHTSGAARSRR